MHKTCLITLAKEKQKQITTSHDKHYTYLSTANTNPHVLRNVLSLSQALALKPVTAP